jgi:short-subunit dehydrogenase
MRILLTAMCALFAVLLCAPAQPAEQTGPKAVLVTGASSGIGRKITEHLAANGYFVYATARKEADLKPDIVAYVMSKHAVEGLTDSLVLQLGPLGVQVSAIEPGACRSDMDKNILARLTEEEKAHMLEAWGPMMDSATFPEADEVAIAVAQALSEPSPKRRYLAIPRNSTDRINSRLAERLIRWQMKQLVQWNEGHAYTLDRATLIKMLDEALVDARPRSE